MARGRVAERILRLTQAGGRRVVRPALQAAVSQLVLEAPNGTHYEVTVNAAGALLTEGTAQLAITNPLLVGAYELSVDNGGALLTQSSSLVTFFTVPELVAAGGIVYRVSADGAGALLTEAL